jgi:hypothetical protein
MGRVAQTPLAAVGLLTPAPRSAATTAHRHVSKRAAASVAQRGAQITLVGAAWTASRRTETGAPNGGFALRSRISSNY